MAEYTHDDTPDCRLSVAEHAAIGNLRTCALVGTDATLDYLCYPRFDSATLFAALLDPHNGGAWRIAPQAEGMRSKQFYLPDTNVLLTRFDSEDCVGEVVDLMPLTSRAEDDSNRIIRLVRMLRGSAGWTMRCAPRFDYNRQTHRIERLDARQVLFQPSGEAVAMRFKSTVDLDIDGSDLCARFSLGEGESAAFVLADADEQESAIDDPACERCLEDTLAYWRAWAGKSSYNGRYREMVTRSALVLKLLSSRDHGSIVAAPTFGLPETFDGQRRWDYRYVWIRDAAFTLYALVRLGYTEEAGRFMGFMAARTHHQEYDGRLELLYTIDGQQSAGETALDSLQPPDGGSPLLIGNDASKQLQLDIYGALLDAVYLYNKYGDTTSYDGWRNVAKIVDYVSEHWRDPDHGIWEARNGMRELLHSRLMCWVTVDRAVRLAHKRSLPAPLERWNQVRAQIYESVFEDFWNAQRGAFVQARGSDALDAACLMMPLVKFIAPKDPRWLSTLDAIGRELYVDPFVYRYAPDNDGVAGREGTFTACSFWYVEALARAGRLDQARLTFEKLLTYANHVGLYSEELSPGGVALGNFPQALTHLALISAAYRLDRMLDGVRRPWEG